MLYSSARLSRDRLERELLKHKTLLNIVLNSIKLACTANQPPSYFTKVSQASDCATRAPPADQVWGPLIHHKQELPFSWLTVMKYETSRFHCFCSALWEFSKRLLFCATATNLYDFTDKSRDRTTEFSMTTWINQPWGSGR